MNTKKKLVCRTASFFLYLLSPFSYVKLKSSGFESSIFLQAADLRSSLHLQRIPGGVAFGCAGFRFRFLVAALVIFTRFGSIVVVTA